MSNTLPADKYDESTLMSYQEWKDCGRFVLKGRRMRGRDAVGVPQFSVDQVTDPIEPEPRYESNSNSDCGLGEMNRSFFDVFDVNEEVPFKHHSINEIMDHYSGDYDLQ